MLGRFFPENFQVLDKDMASSSSSAALSAIPHQEKYDVFLSFRGDDTRQTFTSHLHAALSGKKIKTYIDDILERGDKIGPALLEAIEKSKASVIIFSENYADSTWCLDELAHILWCKERYGQIVVPIFYGIDPSYVRKQQGSYAHACRQHEKRFKGTDKVLKWRAALKEAGDMSGFDSSNHAGTEADFVDKVVEDIMTKLNRRSSSNLKGLVGMERRIQQVESLLIVDSLDVFTVGIWGMGGIGKTTLADAVFHQLSHKFEACCFLENVREKSEQKDGLVHLRNTLVSDILKEKDLNISTPTIGSDLVRNRMGGTKVLIVLDDVNDSEQLSFLAGDPGLFGPGSRIIVTTRDKSLLQNSFEDSTKIYEVQGLNVDEALQLFHWTVFKNIESSVDCTELSKAAVDYAGGIPFVLRILGSSFRYCKREEEYWLDDLKEFSKEKIWKVLRLTFDGLKEHEKEIFLDIACFYQGKDVYIFKEMLDICGFRTAVIRVLRDKSLISISTSNRLEMHNLLHEMGRAIVGEQCTEGVEKCKRFFVEDADHELKTITGSPMVQAVFWDRSLIGGGIQLNGTECQTAYDLRLLYVYTSSCSKYCNVKVSLPNCLCHLDWEVYPLACMPSKLSPENLVEIEMRNSHVEKLWDKCQNLKNLKLMDLGLSNNLIKVPDLSASCNIEHIDLHGCENLLEIPSYFQYLDKLKYLNLKDCTKLKYLSEMPGNIEYLNLQSTAIVELPSSVWSAEKLCSLDVQCCGELKNLPSSCCKLSVSGTFSLRGCSSLAKLQELPRNITVLDLSGTAIEGLPTSSVECLLGLVEIKLNNCKNFVDLPGNIGDLKSLEKLDLSGTAILCLPQTYALSSLCWLSLTNCKKLNYLPDFPGVHWLDARGCTSLRTVSTSCLEWIGFDEYNKHFRGRQEQFIFSNCGQRSDVHAQILNNALTRVKKLAVASNTSDVELEEERFENSVRRSSVSFVCPGSKCPAWFESGDVGSSMKIMLPQHWYGGSTGYQFVGFAYSAVIAFDDCEVQGAFRLRCESTLTANDDHHSPKIFCEVANSGDFNGEFDSDHVFVWFSSFDHASQLNYFTATQNSITEASFDFSVDFSKLKVKSCGICMLYAPQDILSTKVNASDDLFQCRIGSGVITSVSMFEFLHGPSRPRRKELMMAKAKAMGNKATLVRKGLQSKLPKFIKNGF